MSQLADANKTERTMPNDIVTVAPVDVDLETCRQALVMAAASLSSATARYEQNRKDAQELQCVRDVLDAAGVPTILGQDAMTGEDVLYTVHARVQAEMKKQNAAESRCIAVTVPESYTRLREAVYALDPAAADDKLHAEWDAAKWAVFNAAVRLVKEQAEATKEDV